ncbi:MAG TPA: hypothetical protein VLD36_08540 [Burkholderiales bacterium]|nr:hypothetical protein [Burkholderiales bacterium]
MPSHPYTDDGQLNYLEGGADIMALGDSWFHYPGRNILEALNLALDRSFVIMAYGESGANAVDYMTERHLGYWSGRLRVNGARTKLFLLSGGGNDFAGVRGFGRIIVPDCSAATRVAECWAPGEPDGLLGRVEDAYEQVIARVRADGFGGPVVVHNYDYAIPTGEGFLIFGNWLKAPMDLSGVPQALRRPLVRELIDRLETVLRGLDDPAAQVYLVDSAGTLTESEWANELHPTGPGFERLVRECWMPVVAPLLGVPVPAMAMAAAPTAKKKAKKAAKKKPAAKKAAKKKAKKHS